MRQTHVTTSLLILLAAGCTDSNPKDTHQDTDVGADTNTGADTDTGADTNTGADTDTGSVIEPLNCEVAIIGGGAGGLHTAFRLAPSLGEGVCLFEKEAELGGRIHDVSMDGSADSPRVGTGARRVMEGQEVLFDLADELEIEFEIPEAAGDIINARGEFAFSKNEFVTLYPNMELNPETDSNGDQETWLYDQLRFGPERDNIDAYPDFRNYIQAVVGGEGYQFLRDMSRFRGDFDLPLSARGYLDFLDQEWDVCCEASYPVGGMSRFIAGMQQQAEDSGARIFPSEPVAEIRRADGGGYELVTSGHVVKANKVVIAVPPSGFDWITGDIADEIKAQAEYKSLIGVKVVSITQWWEDSWWLDVHPNLEEDAQIWRAWTTENCVNFIEIPQEPYAADQKVTRSVYNDDPNCAMFWEELATYGDEAVEAEVKRGLEHLFVDNGLTSSVTIPDPLATHVQIWPAGWYYLRAGSTVTLAGLYDWAVNPLPDEEVVLVGEAYNAQRAGWSDAAYKSSIHALNARYGMDLEGI